MVDSLLFAKYLQLLLPRLLIAVHHGQWWCDLDSARPLRIAACQIASLPLSFPHCQCQVQPEHHLAVGTSRFYFGLLWPRCFSWKRYYYYAIHLRQWFSTLSACKNHWWSLKINHLHLAPPPPPPGSALLVLWWHWSWLQFKSLFRWS